jgi:hypothetical protein
LTTIRDNAFDGCINLSQVSFPKSSNYGANIFAGVTTLTSVTTGGTTAPDWHTYYPNLVYYSNSTATTTANSIF